MRLLLISTLLVAGGCVSHQRELQVQSSGHLCCPAEQIAISDYERGLPGFSPATWNAEGCGRRRLCNADGGADNFRVVCLDERWQLGIPQQLGVPQQLVTP